MDQRRTGYFLQGGGAEQPWASCICPSNLTAWLGVHSGLMCKWCMETQPKVAHLDIRRCSLAAMRVQMTNFLDKSDQQISTWIDNHINKGATATPLYRELLEERARRAQLKNGLNIERSLEHLIQAAISGRCTSYGELAQASGVPWSKARHQMNGANGHLDRLLDVCHARGLPLLTAICVNQSRIDEGELSAESLAGFVAAARRLGIDVTDAEGFHLQCKDECWAWGKNRLDK